MSRSRRASSRISSTSGVGTPPCRAPWSTSGATRDMADTKNISDALLWLEEFPGPGLVVGVDAFEDFAFD